MYDAPGMLRRDATSIEDYLLPTDADAHNLSAVIDSKRPVAAGKAGSIERGKHAAAV
jgi:hypothetical protein